MGVHTQMLAWIQVLLYQSISGDHREAEMDSNAFFFPYTKVTWSQQHKAGNTHSHLTNLPSRLCGILTQPVFKCVFPESLHMLLPSLQGYSQPRRPLMSIPWLGVFRPFR